LGTRVFETGIKGLDAMLGGGIRWGSSVTIASDLLDRVTLCHQIVANALRRRFLVYYLCFKEAPERLRLLMEESNLNPDHYEKKRLLRFYTPLETELTQTLNDSAELIKVMNKFTRGMMKEVTLHVIRGRKVLFVLNNVSAVCDLLHEDPKWKDFTTKGSSWLRKLVKVVSIQISDLKDLELANSIADFCIVLKNIDGIPYIKATKVSISGWVPYRLTQDGIEVAEEFL
jgi:KaiC/GvpD/RAD55 family RecA-like ATPase